MKRCLVSLVTVGVILGLAGPAGAETAPADPVVGDQVVLDGGPQALSSDETVDVGEAPVVVVVVVVDEDGTVLASSVDEYSEETSTDPSDPAVAQPRNIQASPQARAALGIGPCNPATYADNPHKTGGEVSAHGWWRKGTCKGTKATVRVCLLEWWRDSHGKYRWVNKGCHSASIKQAGKSRKPAVNKRRACTSSSNTGWANLVDVDVDVAGTWDNTEDGTKLANVYCRVAP